MSVALAYVHGESVKAQFMESVRQVEKARPDLLVFGQPGAGIIARGRNLAVERFLRTEMDWLWFVDADMVFQPSILTSLLETGSWSDVVAAAYWRSDNVSTWSDLNLAQVIPGRLRVVEIGYCGMGCTLINRRVLLKLKELRSADPWPWFGHDLVNDKRLGEDYSFCYRARTAGFKIRGLSELVAHYKLQAVPPPRNWGVEVIPS